MNRAIIWIGLITIPLIVLPTQFIEGYITPKWLTVFVMTIFSIAILGTYEKIYLPQFEGKIRYSILALVIFNIINYFVNFVDLNSAQWVERTAFIVLILSSYNFFLQKQITLDDILWPLYIVTFLVLLYGYKQFYYVFPQNINLKNEFSTTFGNINMAAQFIGISLIFQLYSVISLKTSPLKYALLALYSLSVVYLYLAECRSVTLGVMIMIGYLLAREKIKFTSFLKLNLAPAAILLIGAILFFVQRDAGPVQQNALPASTAITQMKENSLKERIHIWKGVVSLFKEHPFGIGRGRFEFASLPYKKATNWNLTETVVDRSPHNEYLRLIAEDGIIYLACFLFLLYCLATRYLRSKEDTPEKSLVICFGLFMATEAFFQFPFENSFPAFITAIFLGYFLSDRAMYGNAKIPIKQNLHKYGIPVLLVAFIILTIKQVVPPYFLAHYHSDYNKICLACKIDPANWSVHIAKAQLEVKAKQYPIALKTLQDELKKRPYNFPAFRLLALIHFENRDLVKCCQMVALYDDLFNGRSALHGFRMQSCGGLQPIGLSEDFRGTYEKFVSNELQQMQTNSLP